MAEPCLHERDAVAWLQGELDAPSAERFAAHVQACASCRAFVGDARRILAGLTSPGRARLGAQPRPPSGARARLLAVRVAAALVVASLAVTLSLDRAARPVAGGTPAGRHPSPPGAEDASWLARQLGPDGTWDLSGAPGAQRVALHAVGLLALLESDAAGSDAQVHAAARWLLDEQGDDGSIGLPLHAGYSDHPVATLALLEASRRSDDPALREGAASAVAALWRAESRWGLVSGRGARNAACRAWAVSALAAADELGFGDFGDAVEGGWRALAAAGPVDRSRLRAVGLGLGSGREPPSLGPLYAASLAALDVSR